LRIIIVLINAKEFGCGLVTLEGQWFWEIAAGFWWL